MILRFPPSPTGKLTIGNIYILINILILNLKSLKYLLIRIDDTDKKRLKLKFIKNIIKKINNININYKSLFFQSNKNYYYFELIEYIYKKKKIYLNKNYKNLNFIKIYNNVNFFFNIKKKINIINKFSIKLKNIKLKNFIKKNKDFFLLKYDKNFSYNYSSIIDDLNSNINFLIRGVEHINNIKNQIIIILILKKNLAKLIHLPLILNKGKKISKRNLDFIEIENKIFYIYFEKNYSFIKIINNFNIKNIKIINFNFDINKILKIENKYKNLINLNYFNKIIKFKKKIINFKIKIYIKFQNLKFKENFFFINKINFLNINIIKKFLFKNLFLNKKIFLYLYRIFTINIINFNNYNKYRNYQIFKKKYFISFKSLNMLLKSLKIKI